MGEKNKIKFKINGSEFLISAEEDKEYIVKISKMVDKRIQSLANENTNLSTSMATVLAALNYCDELEKQKKITAELLRKNDELEAAAQKAKDDLQSFSVENEQLKEEKKGLHARIESLKAQLQQTRQRPQHTAQGHGKPFYQKGTGAQAAVKETSAQRTGQNPMKIIRKTIKLASSTAGRIFQTQPQKTKCSAFLTTDDGYAPYKPGGAGPGRLF